MSKIIKQKYKNKKFLKPQNFEKQIFHISIFNLKELLEFSRNL